MSERSSERTISFERERGVTDVRVSGAMAYLIVHDRDRQHLRLLKGLADAAVPVRLVKFRPDGVSFALRQTHLDAAVAVLQKYDLNYTSQSDLAIVSTIAGAMRDLSGIIAQIFEALIEAGVSVHQTGDAYNAVHCLVDAATAERAVEALRVRFDVAPEAMA
jgi:aspartate kinase